MKRGDKVFCTNFWTGVNKRDDNGIATFDFWEKIEYSKDFGSLTWTGHKTIVKDRLGNEIELENPYFEDYDRAVKHNLEHYRKNIPKLEKEIELLKYALQCQRTLVKYCENYVKESE